MRSNVHWAGIALSCAVVFAAEGARAEPLRGEFEAQLLEVCAALDTAPPVGGRAILRVELMPQEPLGTVPVTIDLGPSFVADEPPREFSPEVVPTPYERGTHTIWRGNV